MSRRKTTDFIVIHSTGTPPAMEHVDIKLVDDWHRKRGWLKIGYHYLIKKDGTIETGRNPHEVGAHCKGYNGKSVSICWLVVLTRMATLTHITLLSNGKRYSV